MVLFFERYIDLPSTHQWMAKHWSDSLVYSLIYVVVIFGGQYLMRSRRPFELRNVLILWNAALAIFSIAGATRVWPEFITSVQRRGIQGSLCQADQLYEGESGVWLWLFTLSKLWELGDTVFLVLRKRPVIFLHWYHHIATMTYTWYVYQFHTIAALRWGMFMNYTVHSLMYSYYTLRAASIKTPLWVSMAITTLQIVQMIIGSYVCASVFAYVVLDFASNPHGCVYPTTASILQVLMYLSYLFLFCKFFYNTYVSVSPRSKHVHVKQA